MEVDKKYALKKWPDSAYIDTLERFFANELVKQPQKQKAEITMNMNSNIMSLPKKSVDIPEKKSQKPSAIKNTNAEFAESFPDRFFYALYKLSENPSSKEFGKKHRAKDGETLDDLLLRIYGANARRIPKNLSENMLKGLNPGVDFSSLPEGEMVLLPDVK
jgi:phage tail protein X